MKATPFLLGTALLLGPGLAADDGAVRITERVPDAKIEIWKARRQLRLYSGETLLREYRIGLGYTPKGQKLQQGDGATPEGEYFVCVKNPQSQFHLSLALNYPNRADAERGRAAGLITAAQYGAIIAAERAGRRPPWDTRLGGEIFIHGGGSGADWTWGCPALDNRDIEELYAAVVIGTPVEIHP